MAWRADDGDNVARWQKRGAGGGSGVKNMALPLQDRRLASGCVSTRYNNGTAWRRGVAAMASG